MLVCDGVCRWGCNCVDVKKIAPVYHAWILSCHTYIINSMLMAIGKYIFKRVFLYAYHNILYTLWISLCVLRLLHILNHYVVDETKATYHELGFLLVETNRQIHKTIEKQGVDILRDYECKQSEK